ncbi:hypothetical protein Ae406Ps2_6341c [Pseudonocardia sp. Ae406_Ps2]|uniref:hypothetical protein n=1 Tax=unclassified Pseudonocardia TaxID=2619320 RepID=UPI00094B3C25|nr:hypothetical protein [Pseudonocardia sp. Ae406_Ps2]OLL89951.1 hypothetical protein Ae406Ps2_6341c [Pseudonocardia sp. Ae406_Ps2]
MTSTPYLTIVRDRVEDQADDYAGPDTPAANPSYQDWAETCARRADQLAGRAEQAARRTADLLDALQAGDVLLATRYAIDLRSGLRTTAGLLGELHTDLDEMGATTITKDDLR